MKYLYYYVGFMLNFILNKANKIRKLYIQEALRRKVGNGINLNGSVTFTGVNNLTVGENVWIGEGSYFRCEGGVEIGDNAHISRYVTLYSFSHDYNGDCLPFDDQRLFKKVKIGRNVWIGMHVFILPGAIIEDGAIIGGGAVVHGTVAAGAIYAAAKGKEVSSRDMSKYQVLENAKKYSGKNGVALKK